MPNAQWVMSEVKINDGLDAVDGTVQLDGDEEIKYLYAYDGGVKSIRERKFLGFTRVETIEPTTDDDLEIDCPTNGTKEFLSYVTEYGRLFGSDFQTFVEANYKEGLVSASYKIYNRQDCGDLGSPRTHLRELLKKSENTYEYYAVDGQYEVDYNTVLDLGTVEEVDVVFPALLETETISIPQKSQKSKFHATKRDFKYDDYFNLKEAKEDGGDGQSPPTTTTSSVSYNIYDFKTRDLCALDLDAGNVTGATLLTTYGGSNEQCYRIEYVGASGYTEDTVCISLFDLNPCPPYIGASCDGGANPVIVTSYHKKTVTKTITTSKTVYSPVYTGSIIAKMTYHQPNTVDDRTNEIASHKIYLGSDIPANLYRYSETVFDQGALAPTVIKNHNEDKLGTSGYPVSNTDISYDTYGNVTSVTLPTDANGQRTVIDYTYDNLVHSFVALVENTSLNLSTCMSYDMATGQLLKKVDPNDNPVRYVYDDFYRLKEFWAPYELFDGNRAATITFEYYPYGYNEDGQANTEDDYPVAITNHNINGTGMTGANPQPKTTYDQDCDVMNFRNLSTRPSMLNPLQTATFMDGMQRVVQIKKDQPKDDGTSNHDNIRVREVSGWTEFNREGQSIKERNSFQEASADNTNIGDLLMQESDEIKLVTAFDYQNRILTEDIIQDGGTASPGYTYDWQTLGSDNYFTVTSVIVEAGSNISKSLTFLNHYGQTVGSREHFNGSNYATTEFVRNPLDGLKQVTDPRGVVTNYTYDDFGQLVKEDHADKGITEFYFDKAGNNTKVVSPATGSAGITMTYDYGRLIYVERPYNNHIGFTKYEYGEDGTDESINAVGRVKKIYQGDPPGNPATTNPANPFLEEYFEYDALGNKVHEKRDFRIPMIGLKSYTTEFNYDSWGRVNWIEYPDQDKVTYTYDDLGIVEQITAKKPFKATRTILDGQTQDGYGNTTYIKYGNGTETEFTYQTLTRRLSNVTLTSGSASTWLDKDYTYDLKSNVTQIENSANGTSISVGDYTNIYQFDMANRLTDADIIYDANNTTQKYDYGLDMVYLDDGSISSKTTEVTIGSGSANTTTRNYLYKASPKVHQLQKVTVGADFTEYAYNTSGSILQISESIGGSTSSIIEKFRWDENQVLQGVENANGRHHYLYDHNGIRVMKSSVLEVGAQGNGGESGGSALSLDPYTTYVNAYYIETNYSDAYEYSKHYYNGAQRISTKQEAGLQSTSSYAIPNPLTNGELDLKLNLEYFGLTDGEDFDMSELLVAPSYANFYGIPECEGETQQETDECICKFNPIYALIQEIDCDEFEIQYWYHPDHLGHTEFFSDANGDAYQYFWYSPFGDALVEEHANAASFSSRYLFNAKELDPETGRYYYGARYYDPGLSIWLSVDPLAGRSHNLPLTPYHFSANNPINIVDPNGLDWYTILGEEPGQEILWFDNDDQAKQHYGDQEFQNLGGDVTSFNPETGQTVEYFNDGTKISGGALLAEAEIDGGRMGDHARTMNNKLVQSMHQNQGEVIRGSLELGASISGQVGEGMTYLGTGAAFIPGAQPVAGFLITAGSGLSSASSLINSGLSIQDGDNQRAFLHTISAGLSFAPGLSKLAVTQQGTNILRGSGNVKINLMERQLTKKGDGS